MSGLGVPCTAKVRVTVTSPARHLCPFKDEVDHGTVRISWTTGSGETLELHGLAGIISAWEQTEISHEQWTAGVATAIRSVATVDDLVVSSEWTTAGLSVSVAADRAEREPGGES